MQKKFIHPVLGEITVSCTLRAKRISVSIRPPGRIRASMPPWVDMRELLRFIDLKQDIIQATVERIRSLSPIEKSPENEYKEIELLRKSAKEYLSTRCSELSLQTGLKFRNISIRASRSRWGSCSARDDISLSLFLMRLPDELIDFVIIHELCHTVHKNHSAKFHNLLNNLTYGREKELNTRLRSYKTT